MSQLEIETKEMEDVEREDRSCDLCKLSYTNEEALQEHYWSLMHHIKIEQKKKGASHNCSLCFAICPNIIEYGKHLNGDKHKRALEESRRLKEGEEEISSEKQALLDKISDMEKVHLNENNSDDDTAGNAEPNLSDPESRRHKLFPRRKGDNKNLKGHHRSYSQPNSRYSYAKDNQLQSKKYQNENPYEPNDFRRKLKNAPWYDDSVSFDNPYWHDTEFHIESQPWNMHWQNGWNNFDWMQNQYQDYNVAEEPAWGESAVENYRAIYPNVKSVERLPGNRDRHGNRDIHKGKTNKVSFQSDERLSRSCDRASRSYDKKNRLDSNKNYDHDGIELDSNGRHKSKSNDSGNLKRRRNEHERGENKSKRECDSSGEKPRNSSRKDKETSKRNRHEEVSSSDKSSLSVKRYRPVIEKCLDEADSTTDIDGVEKVSSKSSGSKSCHTADASDKKKVKPKKKKVVSQSPTESPKRTSSDKRTKDKVEKLSECESILDKAERLCKDLRDKREKAKMEREKKEKQKKIEKTEELNTQIKNLSNINKSYVKGVLSIEKEKLSKVVSSEGSSNLDLPSTSVLTNKEKVAPNEPVSSSKPDEQIFFIDRIRKEIEESVRNSPPKRKCKENDENSDKNLDFSISEQAEPADNLPMNSSFRHSNRKSSTSPVPKDSLLKMINSPRSRKERLYIADMLRSYAKSQNKLSLPRFNLQLSGLYDDMEDTAQDLHLEELSPDVQLQIAQLIEADIKPDIEELEKALSVSTHDQIHLDSSETEFIHVLPKRELFSPDLHLPSEFPVKDVIPETKSSSSVLSYKSPERSHKSPTWSKKSSLNTETHSSEKKTGSHRNNNLKHLPEKTGTSRLSSLTDNTLAVDDQGNNSFSQHDTTIKQEPTDSGYGQLSNDNAGVSKVTDSGYSLLSNNNAGVSKVTDSGFDQLSINAGVSKVTESGYSQLSGHNAGVSKVTDTGYDQPISHVTHADVSKVRDNVYHQGFSRMNGVNVSRMTETNLDIQGNGDKDAHSLNLTSIHEARDVLDHIPQESTPVMSARSDFSAMDVLSGSNSEVDKAGSSHLSNVSLGSSVSSLHSESFFETVYDISLKEENLRQDITKVDSRINDLKRVIDEANHHLQKCQEKKQKLMAEEEALRTQRLKILKDAKDIQRSSRNLTHSHTSLSDNLLSRVYSASTSNLSNNNNSTLTNVSSLSASTIGLVRHVEPERDHHSSHGASNSLPPPGKLKQRKHSFSESEKRQKENISTSVRLSGDITASISHQDCPSGSDFYQIETERLESVSSSVDVNDRSDKKDNCQVVEESTSPVAFKSKKLDRLVHSQLPPPLEPVRVSESLPSHSVLNSNPNHKLSISKDKCQHEQPNSSMVLLSPPQNKDRESLYGSTNRIVEEGAEVDRSTELKKVGFVTLNSLLKPSEFETSGSITKMLSSEASSLEEFLSGLSDSDSARKERKPNKGKKVRRSKRLNPEQNTSKEKEDEKKKFSHVNVKFMGTLPNVIDKDSFLKEIGGGKQPDKLSYMVVDSGNSQDVLQKLQSMIGTGSENAKDVHVESVSSVTTSSVGDTKLMDLDYKSESSCGKSESLVVHQETDSNYESIASNCSLGEKIKRYCKTNNPGNRKRKEVSIEHSDSDSDLDKTLKDEDATPVKGVKACSVILQKMAPNNECEVPVVGSSPTVDILNDEFLSGPVSPSRKRLKTKKERDRKSVRKQKEEYIIDSSSEGNSVDEEEDLPKLADVKQKLKFKTSKSPVKEIDLLDLGLVETGSEDMLEPELLVNQIASVLSRNSDKRKSLLDEVQLETESEDNRTVVVTEDASPKDKFKLKPDVLTTFREAVENSIRQGKDFKSKEEVKEVMFDGPESPVLDLQCLDDHLYVCYRCMIIRQFHLKTGELIYEYMTKPAVMNCIHVTAVNSAVRLYAGGHSKVLMLFDSKVGNLLSSESYEESIQCMHGSNGRLYMGTVQGSVIVKHIKTGKIVDTFRFTEKPISCITSATEGTRKVLLIASHDNVIYVCDSSSGLLIRMLEGHNKSPFCVNVDGHTVYSGSVDKTVLEHHLLTGDLIWTYNQPEGIVSSVAIHKDYLLCSSYDKFIYCFDKKNRKPVKKLYGAGKGVIHKMIITSAGQVISGSRDGQVEAITLLSGDGYCCNWKNCDEVYGLKDHLFHHLQTVHMQQNTRLYRCQWKGCNDWVSSEDNGKEANEHMTGHLS